MKMKMKSRDQKNEKATEARKQITNGVPKSLARMRVSSFFSVPMYNDEMIVFRFGNA